MAMRTIAVLVVLALIGVEAQEDWRDSRPLGSALGCGVCGGGEVDESTDVENKLNIFKSSNGDPWTCDYLQKTLQDVSPLNIFCGFARCVVPHNCCKQRNPICDGYVDLNPPCDICSGGELDPDMADETQGTLVGTHSCQGLVLFAREGGIEFLDCLALKSEMSACCKYGSNTGGDNTGGGNTASTKRPTKRPTKWPTNQATQPTNQATQPTKRPTNQATKQKDKKGKSKQTKGAAARALDGEESTTSGSVGISSGLMGILVALVGLCIAR